MSVHRGQDVRVRYRSLRRRALRAAHRRLAHVATERALVAVFRRLRGQSALWTKVAPQPSNYSVDQVRAVTREGLRWELRPHDFCQWNFYFGFPDRVLDTALDLVGPGDVVFDIGANVGIYTCRFARKVGCAGEVHAFEPHPQTFEALVRHVAVNRIANIRVNQLAISDSVGATTLFDHGGGDSGKFSARAVSHEPAASFSVRTETVDAYVTEHDVRRLDLLKIDVEGLEPAVLFGAAQTLRQLRPWIVFELTPEWSATAAVRGSISLLAELGYRLYSIDDEMRELTADDLGRDAKQLNIVAYRPALQQSVSHGGADVE